MSLLMSYFLSDSSTYLTLYTYTKLNRTLQRYIRRAWHGDYYKSCTVFFSSGFAPGLTGGGGALLCPFCRVPFPFPPPATPLLLLRHRRNRRRHAIRRNGRRRIARRAWRCRCRWNAIWRHGLPHGAIICGGIIPIHGLPPEDVDMAAGAAPAVADVEEDEDGADDFMMD